MKIEELLKKYALLPQVGALANTLGKKSVKTIFLEGLMCSSAPMLFASLVSKSKTSTTLFILQDADEAGYFYHDLTQLFSDQGSECGVAMGKEQVLFFPSSYRRAIKYAQRDSANEILRTEVLASMSPKLGDDRGLNKAPSDPQPPNLGGLYVVTYPEAIAELVVSKKQLDDRSVVLSVGDTIDADQTAQQLRSLGFQEVDYVYEPGQFALRGSILDVYSYSSELPFRIDLFGDDIDSIRTFEVETQLSKDKCQQVTIVPELVAVEEKMPFLSFVPKDTLLVVKDFLYVRDAIDRIYQEGFSEQALTERMEGATEQEQHEIMQQMRKESQLISGQQFTRDAIEFRRIEIGHRPSGLPDATIEFHVSPQPQFHKNFDLLQQSLEQYLADGYQLCILADSKKQLERLRDIFSGEGSEVRGERIDFSPVEKTIHEGFADNDLRICVFTDHQIFDRYHKYSLTSDKARSGKVALTLKEIQQFEVGDYVVHVDHGIGKFGGLVRMPQGDGYQEMIKIMYEGGGSIYVSIHSLYKVSKYKAQDNGQPPRLSHLAYSADSYMQQELEASFLYEDTPDQLKATNDVKADMEKAQPMDRLVCGDVGFGKTEVAVRAAFKAACDGKQVAVLVPTTVLAYQHYQTFTSRLKDMPVRVDYLSRARSTKQTSALLKELAEGKVDIIIGTHKLPRRSCAR